MGTIDEQLSALQEQLGAVVGDASLCTVSRAAGPVPGVKYLEGAVTALREVRRAIGDGDEQASALERALARWRSELQRAREREMGPDWLAYRAGGVDALEDSSRRPAAAGKRSSAPPWERGPHPGTRER